LLKDAKRTERMQADWFSITFDAVTRNDRVPKK